MMRSPWLIAAVLTGCSTPPVQPPDDVSFVVLGSEHVWSGDSLRITVRQATGEVDVPVVQVDGVGATVTRVDDSTFAVPLPGEAGTYAVTVDRPERPDYPRPVTVHGFVSGIIGPFVAGHVTRVPGTSRTQYLGGTPTGLAEFDVATGQIYRTWPDTIASLTCSRSVTAGLAADELVMRGRSANGACGQASAWTYQGPAIVRKDWIPSACGTSACPFALLSPGVALMGTHDNVARFLCGPGGANCGALPANPPAMANLVGFTVGHRARRLITLSYQAAVFNLATAGLVYRFAPRSEDNRNVFIRGAAFSPNEDTLYAAGHGEYATTGTLFMMRSATGAMLDTVTMHNADPLAIAVDPVRSLLFVATYVRGTPARLQLRVFRGGSLDSLRTLEVTDPQVVAAARVMSNWEVVLDAPTNTVYILATGYGQYEELRRAVIAKFTLPPK